MGSTGNCREEPAYRARCETLGGCVRKEAIWLLPGTGEVPSRNAAEVATTDTLKTVNSENGASPDAEDIGKAGPEGIDKSVLALGTPKRHRNKDHLRFVIQQPCLLCGRKPSDAHHIRFVQPRALPQGQR